VSKPRVFEIARDEFYTIYVHEVIDGKFLRIRDKKYKIRLIEKSAADKLAKASKKYFDSMNSFEPDYDYQCECFGELRESLKEYYGEK